jgi:hypothetical protein
MMQLDANQIASNCIIVIASQIQATVSMLGSASSTVALSSRRRELKPYQSNSEPRATPSPTTRTDTRRLIPYTCTSILISNRRVRWHAFFYSFQAPDTRPDTPCIRTSTAVPTHVRAALTGSSEQALLRRRETATRYTADATSRGNDRVVEVSELVFDVDRVPRY